MAAIAVVNNRPLNYTSLLTPGVVPPQIGKFLFNTLDTVTYDLSTLIPPTAQQVTVTVVVRSGCISNSLYNVWLWTEYENNQKDIKFKRGFGYEQTAISCDSETFHFAYSSNHPRLYLKSDVTTVAAGRLFVELFVVGYAQ